MAPKGEGIWMLVRRAIGKIIASREHFGEAAVLLHVKGNGDDAVKS